MDVKLSLDNTTSVCGFEANSDTYGLGVRLGIYLSWLSVVIASALFPKLRADMLDALTIFSVAFFAATVLVSVVRENTYTVEIVIMGYIFFGGAVTCGISLLAPQAMIETPRNRISLWRGVLLCLTAIGMAINTFWFYWIAEPFKATPCGTWIFPFGRTDSLTLRHGGLLIYAIISAVICASWSIITLITVFLFIPDLITIMDTRSTRIRFLVIYVDLVERFAGRMKAIFLKNQLRKRLSNKQKRFVRSFATALSIISFIWSVCGVEIMLRKNKITKVNAIDTTGQLIPLLIGVATIAKLVYNARTEEYNPPQLIWGFLFYEDQQTP